MDAHARCSISGCGHRRGKSGSRCRLYSYPSNDLAKAMWCKLSGRVGFEVKDVVSTTKVCACHFLFGQPNRKDPNHIDYLPSLRLPNSVSVSKVTERERPLRMKIATPCTGISKELDINQQHTSRDSPLTQNTGNDSESLQQGANKGTDCIYTSTNLSTSIVNSNSGIVNSNIVLMNSNSGSGNSNSNFAISNLSFPLSISGFLCPQNVPSKQSEGKSNENIQQESVKEETDCMYSYSRDSLSTNVSSNITLVNTNSGSVNSNMSFPHLGSGTLCPQDMPLEQGEGRRVPSIKQEAIENTECMYSSVSFSTSVNSNGGLLNSECAFMNSNCGVVNSNMSFPQLACGDPFLQDIGQKQNAGTESVGLQEETNKGDDCGYSSIGSSSCVNSSVQFPQPESGNLYTQSMSQEQGNEIKCLKQEANEVIGSQAENEVIGSHYVNASLPTSVNLNSEVMNSVNGNSLVYSDSGVVSTPLTENTVHLPVLVSGMQNSQDLSQKQVTGKESESLQRKARKGPFSRYVKISPFPTSYTEKLNKYTDLIKKWRDFSRQKSGEEDNINLFGHKNKSEKAKRDPGPYCHCSVCNKRMLKCALKQHLLMHREPKFQCEICNKRYREQGILSQHFRVHGGRFPYKCSLCDKQFSSLVARADHERTKHDHEKPYKCYLCECRFKKSWGLEVHMAIHTGKRRFKCNDCGKEYLKQSCLERHITYHEIKKQVTCHLCGEVFVKRQLLKEHLWQHVNPGRVPLWTHSTEEKDGQNKNYTCDICDKHFPNSYSFQKHLWIHDRTPVADPSIENSFECVGCGEKSFTYEGLKKHWLKHVRENEARQKTGHQEPDCDTSDKSFVCVQCGESSLSYQALKAHRRTHAIENDMEYKDTNSGPDDGPTDLMESGSSEEGEGIDNKLHEELEEQPSNELKRQMDDLKCSICKKQFAGLKELKLHTLTHYMYNNDKNCTCKGCGEVFLDGSQLAKHKSERSTSSGTTCKKTSKVAKSKLKRK